MMSGATYRAWLSFTGGSVGDEKFWLRRLLTRQGLSPHRLSPRFTTQTSALFAREDRTSFR
jgi:hypothetical protein